MISEEVRILTRVMKNLCSFAMEAHMVHQSADGRVAVVAIPFKIGAPNPFLDAVPNPLSPSLGFLRIKS